MISLETDKSYYILVDGQGLHFGGGRIFESLDEVIEQFQEWADSDEYEDPKLIGWTIGDCLSNWVFDLKRYDGKDFISLDEDEELNYTITNK
jgi:hypothetical protein